MRYAIISDIHANESALRQVLEDATAQGAETVVCLGDVVGYGPLPKETLALVRRAVAITLADNHDDAVSERQGADDFIDLASDAVRRHREALDSIGLGWLRTLPYDCRLEGAIATHGDFTDPKAFNYVDDVDSAAAKFVRANLLINKPTGPVGLHVEFKSSTGVSLGTFDKTVKASSKDRIKVPPKAISAHFAILRQTPTAQPKVLTFAPSAK